MLFARSGPVGFLSHLRSLRRYDEQEILHVSLTLICLVNAEARQEGGTPQEYEVILFGETGHRVFARYRGATTL
jgi:hypothetical protein